ncbi:glycosyltransferase family 76 protein, partial [Mucor lusitanicus CBS 277.49]
MPLLSRLLANTVFLPLQSLLGNRYTLLLSGVTVANVSFVLAVGALYKLTVAVLPKNKRLAHVSSIAFCLSPPAMFMSSFYTESIFALMTFTGMRWVIEKKYMQSALIWGIASAVRSNAIVYAGFFFYDLVWMRLIHRKNFVTGLLRSIVYTLMTASGFAFFQYYAYKEFCSLDRPWCTEKVPLIYSFVQK